MAVWTAPMECWRWSFSGTMFSYDENSPILCTCIHFVPVGLSTMKSGFQFLYSSKFNMLPLVRQIMMKVVSNFTAVLLSRKQKWLVQITHFEKMWQWSKSFVKVKFFTMHAKARAHDSINTLITHVLYEQSMSNFCTWHATSDWIQKL